ncbi:hypothetical protein E2C01_088046 [Portunus trituberculatus]|uniref:Uncharacterized protein n=1 Tax=Portunus trituberculatus TaxID=210409 RepID=A0A5B7J9Q7_PORTR|nr:hypothetical protein [Portunus trituberculatus]
MGRDQVGAPPVVAVSVVVRFRRVACKGGSAARTIVHSNSLSLHHHYTKHCPLGVKALFLYLLHSAKIYNWQTHQHNAEPSQPRRQDTLLS